MSYTERSRDYATLKVLGFDQGKFRKILINDNLILLISGTIIGIPLGRLFLSTYVKSISTDTVQYFPVLSMTTIFSALGITYVCGVTTFISPSKKLQTVDMVSTLKASE